MTHNSVNKSPIPRPPNPFCRLFPQPSDFFGGYSSQPFFVPTIEASGRGTDAVYRGKERWVESSRVTIGTLPDDVLLDIFDFYVYASYDGWHTLVHVCRRWRNVVFASSRRLHLQLLCTRNRSVKEMLDIWPELPIIILDYGILETVEIVENVIPALELNDRVSSINLRVECEDMERFAAVMQGPFPALTHLTLFLFGFGGSAPPVIPDSFLGGSAPRLQKLILHGIPFLAPPKLLLSATDLVILELGDIPHPGYISPEAIVACLSALTKLKTLSLGFQYPPPRPTKASRRTPHLTRIILPALTYLDFRGATEYLEDLVARIDAPLLVKFSITFFNPPVFKFDVLQLTFSSRTETSSLSLTISCTELDWQLLSLSRVCNAVLLALSAMDTENLYLYFNVWDEHPLFIEEDMENLQWLELLHNFANVKDLHLSNKVPTGIARALQELSGERVTEVLPALRNLFFDRADDEPEPVLEAIWEFGLARKLSGFPVAIHRRRWDSESRTWVVIESRTQYSTQ